MSKSSKNNNSKILTISVAAYNVEDVIGRCLDSCMVPEVLDDIEIIVVDDGSTDSTATIVQDYVKRYPGSFKLVSKENGGYGTTVNTSVRLASGKYYRLLDGDDWIDRDGLIALIDFCKKNEVDWVYTERVKESPTGPIADDNREIRMQYSGIHRNPHELVAFQPSMWQSTFNRELFSQHSFELPAHCLYTDALFMASILPYVKSVAYLGVNLYHYVIGSDEDQSTSKQSYVKHIDELQRIWDMVLGICINHYEDNPTPLMTNRACVSYWSVYQATLFLEKSQESKNRLINLERDLKSRSPKIYEATNKFNKTVRLMRKFGYAPYGILKKMGKYSDTGGTALRRLF